MWHKHALYLVAVNRHCADRFRRDKFQKTMRPKGGSPGAGLWGICPRKRVRLELQSNPNVAGLRNLRPVLLHTRVTIQLLTTQPSSSLRPQASRICAFQSCLSLDIASLAMKRVPSLTLETAISILHDI